MTRKERWLAAFALLFSILPFVLLASTLQIMPNIITIPDVLAPNSSVEISKYNYLFSGFLCLIPIFLVIAARILKAKRVVGRNFTAMVLSAMVLGIVFLLVVIFSVVEQIKKRNIDILMNIDFFGTSAIVLSLTMGMLANFFPDLKQNEILGLKNQYTASNMQVWEKVHSDATDVFMGAFFALALVISGLSICINYKFGWLHLALWVVVTVALLIWVYKYSKYVHAATPKNSPDLPITEGFRESTKIS